MVASHHVSDLSARHGNRRCLVPPLPSNGALNIQQLWASGGRTREPMLIKVGTEQHIRTTMTVTWSNIKIFIACQHTDARYWYSNSVRLSVRMSVRNVPVSDENGLTYRHTFFHHTVAQSFWFYKHQTSSRNSDGVTPCGSAKYRWGIKISRFSTNKSLYLTNDTRYRHSYRCVKHQTIIINVNKRVYYEKNNKRQ